MYYGADLAHALFVLAVFAGVKGLIILVYLLFKGWQSIPYPTPTTENSQQRRPQKPNTAIPNGDVPQGRPQGIAPAGASLSNRVRSANASNVRQPTRLQDYKTTLLKTAWPLIIYASVGALVTAFDPWFVNYWYSGDESIFATFRYGARELPLLAAITNGTIVVVLPRLTEDPSAGLDLLKSSSRRLFHWIFGGAIFLMVTSPWWWTVVFTELFADSLPLFQAYLFVVVSRLLFPVPVLTAMGHTRMLMVFGLLELVINVILSILLTPAFGLMGIIWATAIAYLVDKICLMAYLKYQTGIPPGRYTDWRWFGGYLLAMTLCYLFLI